MIEAVTSAQMRAIERAAIESGAVTGLELMDRAGAAVAAVVQAEAAAVGRCPPNGPGAAQPPGCVHQGEAGPYAAVLCGPGNNGGDGYVVARLLAQAGWRVDVFGWGDPARLPKDARVMQARWQAVGPVRPLQPDDALLGAAQAGRLSGWRGWFLVDALFGIGQRAPLDPVLEPVNRLLDATVGQAPAPILVAVDVLTGLDADTGKALAQRPFPADLVVTFHAPKPAHAMPPIRDARLVVADIGLGPWDHHRHDA